MKTLDDALSTPGVIHYDRYRCAHDATALIGKRILQPEGTSYLAGDFTPSELRRIADHLDPQVASGEWLPIDKHDKNTREAFLGRTKLGWHFVFRWDGEKFISINNARFVLPDEFISLKVIGAGRTEAAVRAEARREALEKAARICADLARHDCSALYAGECIRILIEQEPA